jgi:hypothetical protein
MIKMSKEKWVAVNYNTGEILQLTEPTTFHEALKIFKEHQNVSRLDGFFIYETLNKIQPFFNN